jgi:hypothetical protein
VPQPPMGTGENDRGTPRSLFDPLNEEFRFTLDGAASHENALLPRHSTFGGTFRQYGYIQFQLSTADGLHFPWRGERVWLNPPYGRGLLAPFVKRCASGDADVAVALLPVRTDQAWFHDYVLGTCAEIRWLRGRVKYDGLKAGAPFPSMIVVWRKKSDNSKDALLETPRGRRIE